MREIKFRVWNTETNKMIIKVKEMGVFALKSIYSIDEFLVVPTDEKYPLMQYTGLKDKNDGEIYEGDILKYPYVRSSSVNYTIEIGVIEWSDEYCGFIIDEVQNIGGFCGIESKHMNELEVIGNIYEHSNLLDNNL